MSASEGGYRDAASTPPRVERIRLLARMRVVDSILIPGFALLGFAGLVWFFMRAQLHGSAHLYFVAFVSVMLIGLGALWWRLARPCVLEIAWPNRTLRWSMPGESRRAHSIELESIARVVTYAEDHNDTVVHLVAFEKNDGTRVPLCDDTNVAWGEKHAQTIAERVRRFVERAPATEKGGE